MLKRQFCRTVAHYYVRTYESEEYVERGNFWGYFPFNDPSIGRAWCCFHAREGKWSRPGVLTSLGKVVPLLKAGLVCPPGQEGPATAWAGSQGICSILQDAVRLCHLVEESCRTFYGPPGFCGSWEQGSISEGRCSLWSKGMHFGIFKPCDC